MAAFLLFVLAVGGGVVVADLVRENTAVAQITVFQQPVSGYPEGWLLAIAAGLGFAVAMLLVACSRSTKARANRRQPGRPRRGLDSQAIEPEPDHDRLLDEFFGPDEISRHLGRPARPANLRREHRESQARHDRSRDAPERVRHHSEPIYEQARRAARLHDTDLPFPARDGQRR